jgi:hypothetical protein
MTFIDFLNPTSGIVEIIKEFPKKLNFEVKHTDKKRDVNFYSNIRQI